MTTPQTHRRSIALCVATLAFAAYTANAAITGPYTADSDTLHLYHMDESSAANVTVDAAGGVNPSKQNGATLGNASFTGFGNAGNTSAASNSIIRSSVTSPGEIAPPAGTDGAFTYEAIINVSTSSGSQQIFAMDQNSNNLADRPFFWRIINGEISFQNIANGNVDNRVDIPTTGDDAFVANEWFHVAVTYDGNDNTADNLKFYWTRVDDSRTEANLIGTGTMADLSGTAVYGIGNAFRTVGSGVSANLEGSIDEVRLSGVARGADEFIFAVPAPAALPAGLAMLGLVASRRRSALRSASSRSTSR